MAKTVESAKPPRRRKRGPRLLGAALPGAAGALFRRQGFAEAGVLTDWPEIVGRPLADHTCPLRLSRDGTLTLRVAGAFALELAHLEPQILDRIARYFGFRAVTRLAIVQGPLPRRDPPPPPGPRPLRPDEETRLEALLSETRDENLRRALERLGRAVLGSARPPSEGGGDGA